MEDKVFCSDILDALTQDFFARKGNPIEEPAHVEEIKASCHMKTIVLTFSDQVTTFADRPGYERTSSSLWKQREEYCASLIQKAWKVRSIKHFKSLKYNNNNNNTDSNLSWFAGAQKQSHRCDSEQGEPDTIATIFLPQFFATIFPFLKLNSCCAGGGAGDLRR